MLIAAPQHCMGPVALLCRISRDHRITWDVDKRSSGSQGTVEQVMNSNRPLSTLGGGGGHSGPQFMY